MIEVEHLARGGQAGRLACGGGLGQGGHPVRQRELERLGAGALGHQRQQLLDGQDRVANLLDDDRLALVGGDRGGGGVVEVQVRLDEFGWC